MTNAFSRRQFLLGGLVLAGTGALVACGQGNSTSAPAASSSSSSSYPTPPNLPAPSVRKTLTARPMSIDIGGIEAKTWGYVSDTGDAAIEATAGDVLQVDITNELPESTSIHWHGIALHNAADGVPGMTQPPIEPGQSFSYVFETPHGGTYFYHSHSGLQLDRGLHAPLIVRDPDDAEDQDVEWTIVLDDWLDGIDGSSPEDQLTMLTGMDMGGHGNMDMGGHGGMDMGGEGGMMAHGTPDLALGGDAGDVMYPHYLINGRIPRAHRTFNARPGDKARLRFINAGADTIFKVALGGHRMTVTHTDGFPVQPWETESIYLSMGERVDVEVILGDGIFPLTALAVGKDDRAFAVIRTAGGQAPRPDVDFPELSSTGLLLSSLKPADRALLPEGTPDREVSIDLGGQMMPYEWSILTDGQSSSATVQEGQRLRMVMRNRTMMPHPMHIHGHTWALPGSGGLRKDTVLLRHGETMIADLIADNPGEWAFHCHNAYHLETGMMSSLRYA
ncbi:multicopper oxidase family protein [Corynebacterium sp. CCUG 65737]|uniref:multicopper oxidase family protein n=1 Tax=unclassified Corynebacterium TaxID=2624378 RepID=UPI00210CA31F|nr:MULTISPECIES: multicopper oxidase family protein [unclassified Corynebacterium]MCQ4622956.1 multicopper oxidase family protein [Corynebacterium sp. CCUG 70398]MCQ4624426.1 multicopper oxidase family protein [Corynebacterium sp. CCUG 69979]MCQ4626948.1 multicopper oxidase family protein [Corynebacterium sp. CCUG 65737]